MEQVGMIMVGIYLAVMAVWDRRKKEIPVIPGIVCGFFIFLAQVIAQIPFENWLPGIWVGALLYGISKATRGSIGSGDAMVYGITGLVLGGIRNLELLLYSLLLASVVSIFLMAIKRVGRKYEIPFVPFTAIAYGMVMIL